ncbi:helix-turn-helix protein [Streptomyces sp. 846.5]|nr:helix-turn-helix transcriptional regulator [Streptomyces sp. 846.5]TDT93335.1 helix-turn-helix protein [Streptomyces sp. 846.5]
MSDPQGPTVRRRRLGSELRRLRDLAGLRLEDVAKVLECSTSKISRIETGQGLAKALELRAMLDLYGVTDEDARLVITDIHRRASESGWWEQDEYESVLPSGLGVYVGLEYDARLVQTWELSWVTGLLQTPDYARAVMSSSRIGQSDEVDRLVNVRIERQKRLTASSDPLELWAVMDESVFRRPIGGPETMRNQIGHILELAKLPNVNVQICPLSKGMHPGLRGSFSILEFGPADPRVVYVEAPSGNLFVERDSQVRAFSTSYSALLANALDPEESAALLQRVIKEK